MTGNLIDNRGFTLIEILISLIIVSMGTITLGHFLANAARAQLEAEALSEATLTADSVMKYMLLYEEEDHPVIQEHLILAKQRQQAVTITPETVKVSGLSIRQITIKVNSPALRYPVTLSRLTSNATLDPVHE